MTSNLESSFAHGFQPYSQVRGVLCYDGVVGVCFVLSLLTAAFGAIVYHFQKDIVIVICRQNPNPCDVARSVSDHASILQWQSN